MALAGGGEHDGGVPAQGATLPYTMGRSAGVFFRVALGATYVHANPEDLAAGRDALAAIYRAEESS